MTINNTGRIRVSMKTKFKNITILLAVLMMIPSLSTANEDEVGNWLMYFGTNKINDEWSLHTEFQFRNHTLVPNNTEQLLFRTGLNYHLTDKKMITAGYAYIPSYEFNSEQSAPEKKEHRIWQQYILNDKVGRVKLEHRFRYEQRWIEGDYRDRLRYRLMLFIPINKPVMQKGAVFLGLYNEIFLNTRDTIFDRNRTYGAIGYQISKDISFQVGMMNQQLNETNKWYTQFGLVYNTDFSGFNNGNNN